MRWFHQNPTVVASPIVGVELSTGDRVWNWRRMRIGHGGPPDLGSRGLSLNNRFATETEIYEALDSRATAEDRAAVLSLGVCVRQWIS
jgi:hypothetical protein